MSSFAVFFGKVVVPLLIKFTELACMLVTLAVAFLAFRKGKKVHPGWIAAAIIADLLARLILHVFDYSRGEYSYPVMVPLAIYKTFLLRPMPWIILGIGVWRCCREKKPNQTAHPTTL